MQEMLVNMGGTGFRKSLRSDLFMVNKKVDIIHLKKILGAHIDSHFTKEDEVEEPLTMQNMFL